MFTICIVMLNIINFKNISFENSLDNNYTDIKSIVNRAET